MVNGVYMVNNEPEFDDNDHTLSFEETQECVAVDLGISMDALRERWLYPFNIIEDLFQTIDIYGNYVPFTRYDYSEQFINTGFFLPTIGRVVNKSRQIGFSTNLDLESVLSSMTYHKTEISVASAQLNQSTDLLAEMATMIRNSKYPLPFHKSDIQKETITCTGTGTKIKAYSQKPESIRGGRSIRVYLDEFAFIPNQRDILAAIRPKISRGGGAVTYISTPLRTDDEFMRIFNDAVAGKNNIIPFYCPLFSDDQKLDVNIPLTQQPHLIPICKDIDLNVVEEVRLESIEDFLQEYMCTPVDEINKYYPYELILKTISEYNPYQYIGTGYTCMGIDLALEIDETAFVITHMDGQDIRPLHVETSRADTEDQLARAVELMRIYRPDDIRMDSSSAFGLDMTRRLRGRSERFRSSIEGISYNNTNKGVMAKRLKRFMENTTRYVDALGDPVLRNGMGTDEFNALYSPRMWLPNKTRDHSRLIKQLHNISTSVSKTGLTRFSGKDGGALDDIVNALWLSIPEEIVAHISSPVIIKGDQSETLKAVERNRAPIVVKSTSNNLTNIDSRRNRSYSPRMVRITNQ